MNRLRRWSRFSYIFLAFSILVVYAFPCRTYADTKFSLQKDDRDKGHLIVSMVYDDSESMEGKQGTYCNYTFQLFLSLFSEKDELFITYMSQPKTSANYSIYENRQGRINNLRAHQNQIFTPITAVRTAYERLLNESGKENDSYWLFILTDGHFYDEAKILTQEEIDDIIQSYADTPMQNGNKINIIYVGIGDDVNIPNLREGTDNVKIIHAREPDDIIDILDSCAEVFTECIKIDNAQFVDMDVVSNKIYLKSSIPLEKVILIEQNIAEDKKSEVTALDANLDEITPSEELNAYHAYMDYDVGNKKYLKGQITYWEREEYFKDSFEIDMDKDVPLSDIMLYVKPALELQLEYYDEDNYLVNINQCSMKDILKAKLILVNLENNEKVDFGLVGQEKERNITVVDGKRVMRLAEGKDPVLIDVSMVKEGMIVEGTYSFSDDETYRAIDPIALYKSKIRVDENPQYTRTKLVKDTQGFDYFITINEVPFTRRDMSNMRLEIIPERRIPFLRYTYTVRNNGEVLIKPNFGYKGLFGKVFINWLCVWLIPADCMNLTVSATDMFGETVLNDTIGVIYNKGYTPLELWYYYYPFLVIALIVGYFVKRRFKAKQVIFYIKMIKNEDSLVPYWKRWLHVSLRTMKIKGRRFSINPYGWIPYLANARKCGILKVSATLPFYKKGDSVNLKVSGCEWKVAESLPFNKVSQIALDYNELMEGFTSNKHQNLLEIQNGEFVFIRKDNEIFIYHLGRVR